MSFHVPLTRETRGLLSPSKIQKMKKGAFLINTSRGQVVDLEALREALKSNHLGGAAIDVYPNEPEKNGKNSQPAFRIAKMSFSPLTLEEAPRKPN